MSRTNKPVATYLRCTELDDRLLPLAGYAITFIKRHKRVGHLFRYQSIVCEEETFSNWF